MFSESKSITNNNMNEKPGRSSGKVGLEAGSAQVLTILSASFDEASLHIYLFVIYPLEDLYPKRLCSSPERTGI